MAVAMNPNKALWEKGDFTRIAAGMRESGEALVADVGVAPGMQVLDLASGTGEPALSLAAAVGSHGHVTATDLVPEMLMVTAEYAR